MTARRGAGWIATIAAVARRPRLWSTATGQARRLAPRRWWSTPPFLPLPDRAWLRFRLETQYGDAAHPPVASDIITWLEWARTNQGSRRSGPR